MREKKRSATETRMFAAIERKRAAQAKINDCLKSGSPANVRVIGLMEALYERQMATAELFKAALANAETHLKNINDRI
jgi:hypothetical protein